MRSRTILRQGVVPLATIVTIAVNLLIDVFKPNGLTTAQISDSFPNFFVPAGYVFAVWGAIYIALAAYTIWQALPAQLDNPRLAMIAPLYALSCVANVVWLVAFHFLQFGVAMILMLGLLSLLITIYTYVHPTTGFLRRADSVPRNERWFARIPFSIYLGWITVATVANATQLLVSVGWDGFGIQGQTWAVIMIAATVIIALLVFATQRDAAYLLVLVWAVAGIGVKQSAVLAVSMPAWLAVVILAVIALVSFVGSGQGTVRSQPS